MVAYCAALFTANVVGGNVANGRSGACSADVGMAFAKVLIASKARVSSGDGAGHSRASGAGGVGFVVAWWLVWQPVAVIGLLALVALLDSDIQPTVVRSVLLGVLLGQGLGELILASLQAGSGLGLLTIVVALWGLQWGGSRLEMHFVKRAS